MNLSMPSRRTSVPSMSAARSCVSSRAEYSTNCSCMGATMTVRPKMAKMYVTSVMTTTVHINVCAESQRPLTNVQASLNRGTR